MANNDSTMSRTKLKKQQEKATTVSGSHSYPYRRRPRHNPPIFRPLLLLVATLHLASTIAIAVATSTEDTTAADSTTPSSCSTAADLRHRIASSYNPTSGSTNTTALSSLRGITDDVLSVRDTNFLVSHLLPKHFAVGGATAYDNEVTAPTAYRGLSLRDLASGNAGFGSAEEYGRYLEIRERVRNEVERSLGLCAGSLVVDFTHVSEKTEGGVHGPHADNCFYSIYGDGTNGEGGGGVARCDPTKGRHPYRNRLAASIVYLNDPISEKTTENDGIHEYDYEGGEFYWADLRTGEPDIVVPPQSGRMTYFTAGVENLHGALGVRRRRDESCIHANRDGKQTAGTCEESASTSASPRRLALAAWYVASDDIGEEVPTFRGNGNRGTGASSSSTVNDPNAPTTVVKLPVTFLKYSLRITLQFVLLAKRNEPAPNTWKMVQTDEIPLGMVYKDGSGMLAIRLTDDAIVFERHENSGGRRASMFYQLQESMLVHKVLDELEALALGSGEGGEEIRDEDRLIVVRDASVIEDARSVLPARPV